MSTSVFSDETIQKIFEKDGIVSIPFLDTSEINALNLLYHTLAVKGQSREFYSTMFIDDPAYRRVTDNGIREVISEKVIRLLPDFRMLFSNFIVKAPSAETRVGIHQDWNFTLPEYTSVNIWIPLVEIDESTGLFHALRGSHHTFRNIRFTPFPDNAYSAIEKYILQNATAYELKAGDALIYHGGLVHFSDANISSAQRIAIGAALIPRDAPSLHYYKRDPDEKVLELYETNEEFYNGFNFMEAPTGVRKITEISDYYGLPSEQDLITAAQLYAKNIL